MSQHMMGSPSKKVRHESTSSSYLGNHAPESPIQQTSTGANPDQSLFGFEFSDTPTFGGGGTPTMSYLPSNVPNSKDWIMSPTATFSAVPEGFGADPLSPGFSSGLPSLTTSLKLGTSGHARPYRNSHKRGGGAGSDSSLYDESEFEELNGAPSGARGLSAGIALSSGTAVMDEESQEHLSTNKKALADILNRKNQRGGRATPDVGLSTSEEQHHTQQQQQSEGTRLGLSSSLRGSAGSHSNLSYSNSAYSHSNHSYSNHSHSNMSHTNLSASHGGHSQERGSSGNSNGQQGPYTTSFAHFSSNAAQGGAAGPLVGASLSERAAAQASLSGLGASRSTSARNGIKSEKGAARSQGASTTASTGGTSTNGGGAGTEEDGLESRGEEDDGDDNSSNHHSQQSASSHMAGVLAITAAAEYLPFPASDERAAPGGKTTRAGGGTPGKKSKPRRSYGGVSATPSAAFTTEGVKGEQPHDGEHSNLSCESHSSGHSATGGVHSSGVKSNGSVAGSASAISASFLAAYATPAMKLTSSIAASASSSKPITCNCKRSKCLKMYCDCFRLTLFCKDTCRCKECANVESMAAERQAAITSIVDRNPEAFKPRVTADPASNSKGHLTGCHCRKSSCLKKYCECFTGAVPCGERCRCLDCKNAPAIYGSDLKHRLSLSSALGAPGIDRSNPRKDSIGSEGNMDVMSAIMNDKRQFSSLLRTDLATQSLGSPHMNSMAGGGGASYFDPEMSNLSTASLSYSNDAFGRASSLQSYADLSSHRFLHKADSSSKLGSFGQLGSLGAPFSPPRPGTDPSSGANSNRSVLDNDEAAEVLSVMNSPNAYMTIPSFGSSALNGGHDALQDANMTTAGPMFRFRDNHGSHTGMSSVGTAGSQHSHSQARGSLGLGLGKNLLRAEDFDEEDDEDQHVPTSAPGSVVRHTAGLALASSLNIDTEDAPPGPAPTATTATGGGLHFSPSASAYSSPVKPRRPISELDVQSPTLLDLAALCERQAEEREEERKQQFTSPAKTRSFP